jgi:hypothetical protein
MGHAVAKPGGSACEPPGQGMAGIIFKVESLGMQQGFDLFDLLGLAIESKGP